MYENRSKTDGGGIYLGDGEAQFTNCTIADNTCDDADMVGGVYLVLEMLD